MNDVTDTEPPVGMMEAPHVDEPIESDCFAWRDETSHDAGATWVSDDASLTPRASLGLSAGTAP